VSQNAADDKSPLDCTPECPQEEYVYDYQYAGSHLADNTDDDLEVDSVDVDVHQEKNSFQEDYENNNIIIEDYQVSPDNSGFRDEGNSNSDVVTFQEESIPALPEVPTFQPQDQSGIVVGEVDSLSQCPGGDLEQCVDVCPGEYGPRVFGACVSSCGRRCP